MTALWKTKIALSPKAAPFAIRAERASDVVAREALLDACFGENRQMRTCQRLRDGRAPAEGLARQEGAAARAGGLRHGHARKPSHPRWRAPALPRRHHHAADAPARCLDRAGYLRPPLGLNASPSSDVTRRIP